MNYKKPPSGFIMLDREILQAPAFRDLSKTALLAYMDILSKCNVQNRKIGRKRVKTITNNGELIYTHDQENEKGIPRSSFNRAIKELIGYGFIRIAERGVGLYRSANRYAIDNRYRDWNTDRFVEANFPPYKLKLGFRKGHKYYPPKNSK